MNYCTPEKAGISSKYVLAFYKELEQQHLSTHAVILSRGDSFFSECYWAPFHKDFKHRMYSVTKSFVSIAIGFCAQDGLLSLDDPLEKFFPEYQNSFHHSTTILEMLQMTTTMDKSGGWFSSGTDDRAAYYFDMAPQKHPDTLFAYDSAGSFMLGAIVERVTGKPFLKYLQEKVLDDIGFSRDAYCLQCPGGHSWGDSGLMCTARDLWRFSRFVLKGGTWNGVRYLNEAYITTATSPSVPNNAFGFGKTHTGHGYGYQFWGAPKGCFAAKGMGQQVSLCDPAHDFIFVINSCNQGSELASEQIYRALYRNIIDHLGEPLPEDPAAYAKLNDYISSQKLFCLYGASSSPFAKKINGRVFDCSENPTGIRWFRLDLDGNEGKFTYENAQGEKCMPFGFGHNVFAKFPQEGYSDMVGTVSVPGHKYDAAFSADWPAENTLRIRVQIIDKYFGNLAIRFGFRDENTVTVRMEKAAEAFLTEYTGLINAKAK